MIIPLPLKPYLRTFILHYIGPEPVHFPARSRIALLINEWRRQPHTRAARPPLDALLDALLDLHRDELKDPALAALVRTLCRDILAPFFTPTHTLDHGSASPPLPSWALYPSIPQSPPVPQSSAPNVPPVPQVPQAPTATPPAHQPLLILVTPDSRLADDHLRTDLSKNAQTLVASAIYELFCVTLFDFVDSHLRRQALAMPARRPVRRRACEDFVSHFNLTLDPDTLRRICDRRQPLTANA